MCCSANGARQRPRLIAFPSDALDALFRSRINRTAPFEVMLRVFVVVNDGKGIEMSNGRGVEEGCDDDDAVGGDDSGVAADRQVRRGRCRRLRGGSTAAST